MAAVLESFARVRSEADLVLVEGAGSAAEVNLRQDDIANMGFAQASRFGCADRRHRPGRRHRADRRHEGGDRASDAALMRLSRQQVRGDASLFEEGMRIIERHTNGRPSASSRFSPPRRGCRPKTRWRLNASPPSQARARRSQSRCWRASPFRRVRSLEAGAASAARHGPPGRTDSGRGRIVILPGSKRPSPILPFCAIRVGHRHSGPLAARRRVLGVCGGYQMLGQRLADPKGRKDGGRSRGTRLLDVSTILSEKRC